MATEPTSPTTLPGYIQAATPNSPDKRAPWYLTTAPTYAGIFLWFVFWDQVAAKGLGTGGLGLALLGVVLAAVICHYLFYMVPGLLGMKTGLPLYIVGTSTFGTLGGLLMPGFLMGLLQFGWLGVNTYYSSSFLAEAFVGSKSSAVYEPVFIVLCILFASGAAFVGLKGIQYVGKVATFLPLIPLAVLLLARLKFGPWAGEFKPEEGLQGDWLTGLTAMLGIAGYIVGFFATAGAAGVDFGMNNRDRRDVSWGGIVGILCAILITAGLAVIAVDGALARKILSGGNTEGFTLTNGLKNCLEPGLFKVLMIGLTLAAFPGACFSSFIAANSFKTVMPKVNSFLSVGLGALVSILLAVTQVAGDLSSVFEIIGASFGPICGAMCVDYLLAKNRWAGPRAGFNPPGWAAWALGFLVGIMPVLHRNVWAGIPNVPAAPVVAFGVGVVVYYVLAKAGMESKVLPYEPAAKQQA